jgi:hypothetical protein
VRRGVIEPELHAPFRIGDVARATNLEHVAIALDERRLVALASAAYISDPYAVDRF